MSEKLIAYKGFNEKMQCNGGYQYAEGGEYTFPGKIAEVFMEVPK